MKKHAKGLRTAACILGGLLLVYGVLALFPRPDNFPGDNPMRRDGELPILIAHGGGNRTINDEDEMRYLIDIGADGIMTDYSHRLQDVYTAYKTEQ